MSLEKEYSSYIKRRANVLIYKDCLPINKKRIDHFEEKEAKMLC